MEVYWNKLVGSERVSGDGILKVGDSTSLPREQQDEVHVRTSNT